MASPEMVVIIFANWGGGAFRDMGGGWDGASPVRCVPLRNGVPRYFFAFLFRTLPTGSTGRKCKPPKQKELIPICPTHYPPNQKTNQSTTKLHPPPLYYFGTLTALTVPVVGTFRLCGGQSSV